MSISRTILVPMATLIAAGSVAIGSGATFSSESQNSVSAVTAGTLTQSNSLSKVDVVLPQMKPGDRVSGSLVLTNTGTLAGTYALYEPKSSSTFDSAEKEGTSYLRLKMSHGKTVLYDGDFGGLADDEAIDLGEFAPGEAKSYLFEISLDQDAPNSQQGRTASATYKWVGTQLPGDTSTM